MGGPARVCFLTGKDEEIMRMEQVGSHETGLDGPDVLILRLRALSA